MNQSSKISKAIEELRQCASTINSVSDLLNELFSAEEVQEPIKTVTLEEVRAVLAVKSQDGLTSKVKELIQKHGGAKLSDVDPSNYAGLLADAQVL